MISYFVVSLVVASFPNQAAPPREVLKDDHVFSGTWELVSEHHDLDRLPSTARSLVVDEDGWREKRGELTLHWMPVRAAAHPYPMIDLTRAPPYKGPSAIHKGGTGALRMAGTYPGIYHLEGDTLTIVLYNRADPPPKDLKPATGRNVEVWRRIKRGCGPSS